MSGSTDLLQQVLDTSAEVKEIFLRAKAETEAGGLTPETEQALERASRDQERVVTELGNWYLYTESQQKALEVKYQPLREKMDSDIAELEEKKEFIKWAVSQVLPPEHDSCVANEAVYVTYRPSISVIVEDPERLPLEFVEMSVVPNKNEIKKAIQSGATIEGARLSENLSVQIKLGGLRAIKAAKKRAEKTS